MPAKVVLLPGDGIGHEIVPAAVEVLNAVGEFDFEKRIFGGASIDEHGIPLTDETLEACRNADAVLLGAVGGPKWDTTDPEAPRPEKGLLDLRKGLGVYANLRPVCPIPELYNASPLRRERIEGTDLLIVRELTGGIYFGDKGRNEDGSAYDTCEYSIEEIERVARVALSAARRNVTSIEMADSMETSKLWREVVDSVARDYDVPLNHLLVGKAIMKLVSQPSDFDVILTENMLGDILSDAASMLSGSIGMLPSASLGAKDKPGLFEPIHGSAPDIAGDGVSNPLATILSGAMMLRHSLDREQEATAIELAVDKAIGDGLRTRDLGGKATTIEATDAVLQHL